MIHAALGTARHGTLRLSAGHTTTASDIAQALTALAGILQELA